MKLGRNRKVFFFFSMCASRCLATKKNLVDAWIWILTWSLSGINLGYSRINISLPVFPFVLSCSLLLYRGVNRIIVISLDSSKTTDPSLRLSKIRDCSTELLNVDMWSACCVAPKKPAQINRMRSNAHSGELRSRLGAKRQSESFECLPCWSIRLVAIP